MAHNSLAIPVGAQDHLLDHAGARVTVVLYSAYASPLSAAVYSDLLLMRRGLDGALRLVVRHFPLAHSAPQALRAAEAAEAAAAQGKFWEMHDLLCSYGASLDDADILTCAVEIGIDTLRFLRDLTSHRFAARIHGDVLGGIQSGVQEPPAIFVNGLAQPAPYDYGTCLSMIRRARRAADEES